LLLVLDSNEYIFSFGAQRAEPCVTLLELLLRNPSRYVLRLARTTVDDVRRHVSHQAFPEFLAFLRDLDVLIDEDELVPYEFGGKYLSKGLKPGDAFLAGYAEWVGADYLISENRKDFVNHPHLFPFQVRTAERFLREIGHP
jgi:hypothetical protein